MFEHSVLHLTDITQTVRVDVFRNEENNYYYINTQFLNIAQNADHQYKSMSKAISDARVLFYLLNGVQELLGA